MPKPFPKEFREDVIRVYRDSDASVAQVAKDFGISAVVSEAVADDRRARARAASVPARPASESDELREAQQADQAARAGERGPAPGGGVSVAGEPAGKMMYPLVRELAVDGIPVTVTCRVLKIARQPYYRWLAEPGHRRRADRGLPGQRAVRRPPRRPGVRLPVPGRRGPRRRRADGRADRVADLLGPRLVVGVREEARPQRQEARAAGPRRPGRARLHRRRPEPAVARRHHRALDRRGQALPLRDQGRLLQPDRRLLHRLTDEVPARRRRARQRRRPAPRRGRRGGRLHRCTPTAGRSSGPGSSSTP